MTISSTLPTHPWVKVLIQWRRTVRLVNKSNRYTAGSALNSRGFAADCTCASVLKNRLRMNILIPPRIFLSRDWQPLYRHCCGYHDMSPCAQAAYRGKNACHYVRHGALLTREQQGDCDGRRSQREWWDEKHPGGVMERFKAGENHAQPRVLAFCNSSGIH